MSAPGVRARVRAEMTEEIKTVARRHLATDGANLSLRAVARDLGMASSAVYRYFASRDELLTALIIDAYNSVGERAEQAARDRTDELQAFLAMAHAVREWALNDPHQWALIYGSPVPGYQAPQDTIGPATRVILLIASLVESAYTNGRITERPPITGRYAEELAVIAQRYTTGAPPRLVAAALSAFLHLSGAISGELFGQLTASVEEDRRGFFEFQMRGAAHLIGMTDAP
ncbi:TetR family transcriptional regulator [Paractinoplanes abujensis]|uniref:AcrR family transcriptional regulator n=1 Tax=Paractinoplanes abujensis TaxID=882441 RepID=A0A7W7G4A3_9ACTN|nr:TetR/AcrR family transcriptional regulator [Actinoplanes abujensis]MBB4695439.1 AcrR family transcriptional regulator [Actinoplanes abujensis]GID23023.1 TetR family transcriptional regulator [Actinoplanes abujensis]